MVRLHHVVADALCPLCLLRFIETTRANLFPYKLFATTTVNSINAANALINVDKAIFVAHLRIGLHCGNTSDSETVWLGMTEISLC